jgi:subtilisin-like proprotein convertase family protein
MNPLLDWQSLPAVLQYEYQVAFDNMFNNIVAAGTSGTDQAQVSTTLLPNQLYYWRVRATNTCGIGLWSTVFSFTTGSCFIKHSTNVPVSISGSGTPTVFSSLDYSIQMTINDVNVINLQGAHSWVDDLKISLISPAGTERLIWDRPCENHDDFNINFDDEAPNNAWPCPPTNGGNYKPDNTLSVFDGQAASGQWMLKVQDVADQDGGSLNAWGLRVCGVSTCQLFVTQATGNGAGSLPGAISCANPGDTIYISQSLSNQTIDIGGAAITISKQLHFKSLGSNINITGSGPRVFAINTGQTVSMTGLKLTAGTAMVGGAISNSGILKLHNTTLLQNDSVMNASLLENRTGSQAIVTGNCVLGL